MMTLRSSTPLVVTTSVRGASQTQVWNPQRPLALGFPLKWVLEKTQTGVRIRSLDQPQLTLQNGGFQELSFDEIQSGASVELPSFDSKKKSPYSIRIRPAALLDPVFQSAPAGDQLTAYTCVGNWVLSSAVIGSRYVGRFQKKAIFSIRKNGANYTLHSETPELQSSGVENLKNQAQGSTLTADELSHLTLRLGSQVWRFGLSQSKGLTFSTAARAGSQRFLSQSAQLEAISFKKALLWAGGAFGLILLLAWIWPKPTPEEKQELIPTQFASLVMKGQKSAAPAASSEAPASSPAENKELPKKVQDSKVVQAFRAKALNNAVSGLLKGGMTKLLLAQSDFASGRDAKNDTMKIFGSKSSALSAEGPSGATGDKNVQVSSLEGGGKSGAKGGYSQGQHAGVQGQGKSFVSTDWADGSVQEGLTKDEVGEVIHRHLSEVRYCYEASMIRQPDVEGKLIVNFTIAGQGNVKTADIKTSTLPDPRLDDCILRRLVTWKFPKTKGGVDVAVTYPFVFKTLGR